MPHLLAKIAYDRAVHALAQQEAALNELRSRTGTLLAAEALTTSFLGATAIQHGALALSGRLAIVCFAISLGAALFVLLPWPGLQFSLKGSLLYEGLRVYAEDEEEIHRRATYWLDQLWRGNELVIARLYPLFTSSAAVLVIELVLWAVALKDVL